MYIRCHVYIQKLYGICVQPKTVYVQPETEWYVYTQKLYAVYIEKNCVNIHSNIVYCPVLCIVYFEVARSVSVHIIILFTISVVAHIILLFIIGGHYCWLYHCCLSVPGMLGQRDFNVGPASLMLAKRCDGIGSAFEMLTQRWYYGVGVVPTLICC